MSEASRRRVLLLGAGHANLVALRSFARRPDPSLSLVLVSPRPVAVYTGMVPGCIAGHYRPEDAEIWLEPLIARAGAQWRLGEACGLDLAAGRVHLAAGRPEPFDVLSIDIGGVSGLAGVPGAAERATATRPVSAFLAHADHLVHVAAQEKSGGPILVVGGGPAGVEIALALQHRLATERGTTGHASGPTLGVVTASHRLLDRFPARAIRKVDALMASRGIAVFVAAAVSRVDDNGVVLADGRRIDARRVIWAGDVAPQPWIAESGLPLDARGFVAVDRHLRALGHANVFASGDIAGFSPRPLPKAGVYAVREGEILADSLRAAARGETPPVFHPQRDALVLLSTGPRHAIAVRNGFSVSGGWVWRWKDWVDRRFVRSFAVG